MSKKKIIIAIILVLIILIAITVGIIFLINNNFENSTSKEEKTEKEISWGETYLEILKDEENFDDMDDLEIQLLDMDEDEIPELVVYGTSLEEFVAKVYAFANGNNSTEEAKYSLDEKFDIKLKYNCSEKKYSWYAVTEETQNVYSLNSGTLEECTNTDELISAEGEYSKKVDFTAGSNDEEIEASFEDAENGYIETIVVQESIAEMVELEESVDKIDSSKPLVYTKNSYIYSSEYYKYYTYYPAININSSDVKSINDEIQKKGEEWIDFYKEYGATYSGDMNYEYFVSNNVLSVILYWFDSGSVFYYTYNIDLDTYKKLSSQELLKKFDLDEQEVIENATDAALDMYDDVIEQDKERIERDEYYSWDEWKQYYEGEFTDNMIEEIEELSLFINEDGDICVPAHYQIEGGQWSQYIAFMINVTDGYSYELMEDWIEKIS